MGALPIGLVLAVYAAITYLVAGIPFGLLVTRAQGIDVRKVGSGNIGTTNVARAAGKGSAGLTLLLDAAKGLVPMLLARPVFGSLCFNGNPNAIEPGGEADWILGVVLLAAVSGHVFSIYLKFKGGKGIAVGVGCAVGLSPLLGLILLGVFLAFVIPTRYVSLGSCMAAASMPIVSWFMFHPSPALMVFLVIGPCLVIWAHRANIGRLIRGEESKFAFKKD
ncbi:MAG: glycerol-3-phosphate 1-O-acyltransferase PlsY [Atopobiaceae bacterium]|nr:glycerol-3-phosphate 1-O-acyltransferase PlsY [Atopobiaceae bacterium]